MYQRRSRLDPNTGALSDREQPRPRFKHRPNPEERRGRGPARDRGPEENSQKPKP